MDGARASDEVIDEIALIATCFLSAIVLSLSTWIYGMRSGVKALEEME